MSIGLMGFGSLLFSLSILIGQWVGILGLRKTGRNMAWWFMIAGICCSTLGLILTTIFIGMTVFEESSLVSSRSFGGHSVFGYSGFCGLGSLIFTIGFAIHGQQASRTYQRVTELEAIAAAQSEELDRARFRI